MKLYELTSAYRQVEATLEEQEDADLPALLNDIEGELRDKAVSIAKIIQNFDSTSEAIRAAEKRMADRRKALERRADSIRQYLLQNMVIAGIFSIECDHFTMQVRDNPESVVVDDIKKLAPEYLRQKEPEPDKKAILADIKQGVVIDGAHVERSQRLDIR